MKYSKEVENILKKLPSIWTMEEAETIAREIQKSPCDNELKNTFLNLDPANGEYCNFVIYLSLEKLHRYMIREYGIMYSFEEYIESVSYSIYHRSLIDWRPGDSLINYIKVSSLPNGYIGHDIREQHFLISYKLDKNSGPLSKYHPKESEDFNYYDTELWDLLRTICELTSITMEELKIVLLTERDRLNSEDIKRINSILGTDYDKKRITQIRDNLRKKVKRNYDLLKKILHS